MTVKALIVPVLMVGCSVGELSDAEEKGFLDELETHYRPKSRGEEGSRDGRAPVPGPRVPGAADSGQKEADSGQEEVMNSTVDASESPDIPTCVMAAFEESCSGGGCHLGEGFITVPDFSRENLFELLTTEDTACREGGGDHRYVDLEDPAASLILLKLQGDQPGGCGGAMPPDGHELKASGRECLEDWFAAL